MPRASSPREYSPFIPPAPGLHGRGVIPSPGSNDDASTISEDLSYDMRRGPPHGSQPHPYAGYPYPMHPSAQWTPQSQWGHHCGPPHPAMFNGTPWGAYAPPPGYGMPPPAGYGPPPGRGPHPHAHSAPYVPGPLPHDPRAYGPTPYQGYHPMGGTPYMPPQGFGSWMPGSVPMGPTSLHPEDMGGYLERPTDELIRIDCWSVGSHYAPVLTPFQVAILDATLVVNPLLSPAGDNPPPDRLFLNYNVLFPVGVARRSIDPPSRSWSVGRSSPATSPRVTQLRLISRHFPWVIEIEASRKQHGVTCLDVLEGIYEQLQELVSRQHIEALKGTRGETHRRKLYETYHYNRSTARDAPGGSLGEGVRRADWLLDNVMFDGIVNDQNYVREKLGITGPGWKGLNSNKKEEKKDDKKDDKDAPKKLLGWPATLVLKLDQRYSDSEGDRESVVTDVTEGTEVSTS